MKSKVTLFQKKSVSTIMRNAIFRRYIKRMRTMISIYSYLYFRSLEFQIVSEVFQNSTQLIISKIKSEQYLRILQKGFLQIFSHEFRNHNSFFSFSNQQSLIIPESLIILDIFLKNNINFTSLFILSNEAQEITALLLYNLFKKEELIANFDKDSKFNLTLLILNQLSSRI